MKFQVTMKTPDALVEGIRDAVIGAVSTLPISVAAKAHEAEARVQQAYSLGRKWFEDGETLTVEIDTDADTCTVIPR